jgi:predicted DNA-binding transcriptional regulator AlpA
MTVTQGVSAKFSQAAGVADREAESWTKKREKAHVELAAMSDAMIKEHGLLNHAQGSLLLGVSVKRVGELVRLGKLTRFDFLGRTYVSVREVRERHQQEEDFAPKGRGLNRSGAQDRCRPGCARWFFRPLREGQAETQTAMNGDDKLLTVRQVAALVTVSARKIWRDVAARTFPAPVKLGPKTTRWWESEVRQFLSGQWSP